MQFLTDTFNISTLSTKLELTPTAYQQPRSSEKTLVYYRSLRHVGMFSRTFLTTSWTILTDLDHLVADKYSYAAYK